MQRPQEREKKQEDMAELVVLGVHLPFSLLLVPFQLSLGNCLSVSPPCRFLIHTDAQMHTTKDTMKTHTLTHI